MRHHRNGNTALCVIAAAGAGALGYFLIRKCMCHNYISCRHREHHIDNKRYEYYVLRNKIGIPEEELEEAKASGRTAYDLAKEKGFSEEQLKMFIIEGKQRKIDELVLNRKISSELGRKIKDKIRISVDNWDGVLE